MLIQSQGTRAPSQWIPNIVTKVSISGVHVMVLVMRIMLHLKFLVGSIRSHALLNAWASERAESSNDVAFGSASPPSRSGRWRIYFHCRAGSIQKVDQCTKRLQMLTDEIWRWCCLEREMPCGAHKRHNLAPSANDDHPVYELPAKFLNQRKLNKQIISIASPNNADCLTGNAISNILSTSPSRYESVTTIVIYA
jgi:hypothetical protein